jgi:hypothetical protein
LHRQTLKGLSANHFSPYMPPEAKEACPVFKMNLSHRRMLKHPSEGKRPAKADRCWQHPTENRPFWDIFDADMSDENQYRTSLKAIRLP